MLPRQATSIRFLAAGAKEDLGAENIFVARPSELSQGATHFQLALTISVLLSSIKEVDTVVSGDLETFFDNIPLLSATISKPSAKGQGRYFQPAWTKIAVDLEALVSTGMRVSAC